MYLRIAARCLVSIWLALSLAGFGCSKKSKKTKKQGVQPQVDFPVPVSAKLVSRLPVAPGEPLPEIYAVLEVHRDGVFFRSLAITNLKNGRFPSTAKRDGPDGYFVDPIFKRLKNEKRKLRHAKVRGPHCLLLAADRDLSYRTLAEVLYTTAQAEFGCIYVAVNPPPAKKLALAAIRLYTPALSTASRQPRAAAVSKDLGGLGGRGSGDAKPGGVVVKRSAASYKKILAELTNIGVKNKLPTLLGHVSASLPPMGKPAKQYARARAEIQGRLYGLRLCYSRALRQDPKAAGTAKISIDIPPKGRVQSVRVKSALGAKHNACFSLAVSLWHLGTIPKKIKYSFTVSFSPKK